MIGRFLIRRVTRPFRRALFLVIVLAIVAALVSEPKAQAQSSNALEAKVSKVLDGDTFTLSGESRRIRVWGLDAPEWDQRGGSAATATLRGLISGSRLSCAVLDIDRYGRLVAQCFLPDGRDIAAEMIRSGAATEYCRYSGGYYGTCR
jgi:micrococcal nuclease